MALSKEALDHCTNIAAREATAMEQMVSRLGTTNALISEAVCRLSNLHERLVGPEPSGTEGKPATEPVYLVQQVDDRLRAADALAGRLLEIVGKLERFA